MKRIWMNFGVALTATLFTGAMASACAHNDSSVFIRQVFLPTIPTNGECTYTADITQSAESTGIVDLSYPSLANYTPTVLVGNQIVQAGNSNALQTETSRVIISGAITKITDLAGDTSLEAMFATMCQGGKGDKSACNVGGRMASGAITAPVNPFSTVESTAIEPASSSTASYGALALTMVDGQTIDVLREYFTEAVALNGTLAFTTSIQLLTYTKVEGVTLGGDTVESNEFEFPVTFTFGQLVANLVELNGAYCVITTTMVPTTAQTCVYGQDASAIVSSVPMVPSCTGNASTIDAG